MTVVEITGGAVIVDDDIAPFVACSNWHIRGHGKHRYARKRSARGQYLGYPVIWLALHRVIAGVVSRPDVVVDHINGDTLDNRRANLRLTDHRTNTHDFARRTYGNEHPLSKFTDEDIPIILSLRGRGLSYHAIAERFGVGKTIIRTICIGRRGKGTQIRSSADDASRR